MNSLFKKIIIGGALFAIGAVFLLLVPHLPSRTLNWENAAGPIGTVADIFKNLFSSNSVSVLILGRPGIVDGKTIGGDGLTDTIIVVNLNKNTDSAHLISIPRDLWISDNSEQFKINEMAVKNKIDIAANKIEQMTGLSLNGYVMVDLNMVKDAVDYLGGVDVVLSKKAVDWVSGYTMDAGAHHLNGDDAVWLIRNRFDKEGDFFREKNQQQIIESLFSKFKNLSIAGKLDFIEKFVSRTSLLKNSDINEPQIAAFAMGLDLSKISLKSVVLDFSTGLFKTDSVPFQYGTSTKYISIVIPSEGFEKYDKIRSYIKSQLAK